MDWVKIHTSGWLRGSIRAQLTPAERSVWADLLALAGENRVEERRGIIERAKGIPYTREKLAELLDIDVDLLNSTIYKCVSDENADDTTARLLLYPDETLEIGNWHKYQDVPNHVKEKKLAEKIARQNNGAKSREKDTILLSTLRSLNENNKQLSAIDKKVRYMPDGNGNILDTKNGEIIEVADD